MFRSKHNQPRPTRAKQAADRAKHAPLAAGAGILICLAILTGCGSSSTTTTAADSKNATHTTTATATTTTATTPAAKPKKEHLPRVEKVEVTSPALSPHGVLATRYTCQGANTSLPITWKGIPPGTKELMLDIINMAPINGQLYIDWSVAHLNPSLHGLQAGHLPPGATTGTNSTHTTKYTICPPKHTTGQYVIVLFALPHTLPTPNGYNATNLRTQALQTSNYENFQLLTYKNH